MNKTTGLVLFTIAELVALIGWLALVLPDVDGVAVSTGQQVLGIAILLIGLIVEHIIAHKANVGGETPYLAMVGISVSESVIWIVWLVLAQNPSVGPVLAVVFLFVTMFIQHSIEKNLFGGVGTFNDLFKGEIILFTVIEAIVGGLWLEFVLRGQAGGFLDTNSLIGAGILVAGITVEHIIQSSQKLPSPVAQPANVSHG